MNKRGVGLLIANDIAFSVSDREEDPEENFLLLKLNIKGRLAILGSIYRPNDPNPGFFDRLKNALRRLGNFPDLLGGGIGTVLLPQIR